jgi:hypothetical protein
MCDLTVAFNPLSGNSLSPNRLINNCYSLHGGKTSVASAAISKIIPQSQQQQYEQQQQCEQQQQYEQQQYWQRRQQHFSLLNEWSNRDLLITVFFLQLVLLLTVILK